MQSILKIGSALAERVGQGEVGGTGGGGWDRGEVGEVGGSTALPDSAWWQLQLPALCLTVHGGGCSCL